MLYDRKIKYLDYLENGQRIQGVGYLKLERREETLRLELAVTGLRATDSCERDVLACGGGEAKSVGKIVISNGRGQWKQLFQNPKDIGGTGISYEELQGIKVPVGAGRELSSSWQPRGRISPEAEQEEQRKLFGKKEKEKAPGSGVRQKEPREPQDEVKGWKGGVWGKSRTAQDEEAGQKGKARPDEGTGRKSRAPSDEKTERKNEIILEEEAEQGSRAVPDGRSERGSRAVPDGRSEQGSRATLDERAEWKSQAVWNEAAGRKNGMEPEEERRRKNGETTAAASAPNAGGAAGTLREASGERRRGDAEKPVRLLEDKWQQLWAIYPHIKPFRDQREYLSIGPSDFVLFSSASYRMVNNSFLLHGYYNYHHLILARLESKGEAVYYIGVPGSYFEKEKQVAIMFGFESFECAEEPAQPGDFGYYMMRAQL